MQKPIRILQVFGILNRGGAEAMIMNLYRAIDKQKIQFDFVVHMPQEGAFDEEIRNMGGRIFVAPRYNGKNHFKYIKWWKDFSTEHPEYRVVHSHIRSTAAIVLHIAKKAGRVTIAHSHSTNSGKGLYAVAKNILQYPIRYIAEYFMGCSQIAGEWLFGKKVCSSDKYYSLHNAIDLEEYAYDTNISKLKRKEFDIRDDEYLIGTVGRFTDQKNPYMIVDIIAELKRQKFPFKFLWVGTGEMLNEIRAKAKNLGLENVILFAEVRSDVNELLMAMDLFLFPSKWEGLPVAAIEAQAAGLPCIMSDTISKEVCITPGVKLLSIKASPGVWCEEIVKQAPQGHISSQDLIQDAGYDIKESVKWLQSFYIKIANRG